MEAERLNAIINALTDLADRAGPTRAAAIEVGLAAVLQAVRTGRRQDLGVGAGIGGDWYREYSGFGENPDDRLHAADVA